MTATKNPWLSRALFAWVAGVLLVCLVRIVNPARGAEAPADGAAAKAADKARERLKWMSRIVFFGEEDTGRWSLRIQDRDATERATIRYSELWKYDPGTKKWVKVDDRAATAEVVPAAEKPANAPTGSQVIASLPIKEGEVGLFYAKWRVNDGIDGATFCQLGPGLSPEAAKRARKPLKVPPGMIMAVVPLSTNKAEFQVIPDPRVSTTDAPSPAPASRPSSDTGK